MRATLRVRTGWLVGLLGISLLAMGGAAQALSTNTERPGSLLIFPKVTCAGSRQTEIQVANTQNMPNTVHCFYLNGAAGRNGRPVCTSTDFFLNLTKQQPTFWNVCTGRSVSPLIGASMAPVDGVSVVTPGLSPGPIPAVVSGFAGALVCAVSDEDGTPMAGVNAIKGEATIEGPGADVSKYNGVAFEGAASENDLVLDLNGTEYAACPAGARLNFIPAGQTDPVIEAYGNGGRCSITATQGCNPTSGPPCPAGETCIAGQSSVATNVTIVPCDLDFAGGTASNLSVTFDGFDEMETHFSGSTTISCWGTFSLAPPVLAAISSPYATVELSSPTGTPFLAVGEAFHVDAVGNAAAASVNLFTDGTDPSAKIRLY